MGSEGLTNVSNAIAGAEGYGVSPGNIPTRANNPGNLEKGDVGNGTVPTADGGQVTIYGSASDGMSALQNQVNSIATGGGGPNGPYNAYATSQGLTDSSQLSIQQVGYVYANGATNPSAAQNWSNNVSTSLGVDPSTKFSDAVNGTTSTSTASAPNYQTANPPGAVAGIGGGDSGVAPGTGSLYNRQATQAGSVTSDNPTVGYGSLFPDVIIQTGLDSTPWYADKDLVTGNPKVRGSVDPIVFELVLRGREDYTLENSQKVPIQVQLNASLKSMTTTSKHVFTPKRTRTGWHITMWGMQADIIEGNCTTGVFMNQLGLTDFFSTSTLSNDLIQAVTSGFKSVTSGKGAFPISNLADLSSSPTSVAAVQSSIVSQQNADEINNYLSKGKHDPAKAFRIAAQDAFQEFLSLFKNNGIVWFNTQQTLGGMSGTNDIQVDVDQWSPQTALSATSMNARNNDVMTRGSVVMKARGTTYLGYFKSLNWQMNAANPFQWTFSFTFQVEKTLGYIFTPAFTSVSSNV